MKKIDLSKFTRAAKENKAVMLTSPSSNLAKLTKAKELAKINTPAQTIAQTPAMVQPKPLPEQQGMSELLHEDGAKVQGEYNLQVIEGKLKALRQSLLTEDPQMPVYLQSIHSILRDDPETATLLSPEQINLIVQGLSKFTNVKISEGHKSRKTKAVTQMTLDDL